jgi:hypothetical protein
MDLARVSSAALMLSGAAGVVAPERVSAELRLPVSTGRGRAEIRAGLGGTYAALGAWGLLSRDPASRRAVGVTWLGAAAARLASLALDEPETDAAFWAYLAAEIGFGLLAVRQSQ